MVAEGRLPVVTEGRLPVVAEGRLVPDYQW